MPLRVSGKNINTGMALQQRITDRVEEATSKYVRDGYSGHATVGRDGFGFRMECVLHLDSGAMLEAKGMAANAAAPLQASP
jgi:ribosome-associated translation inhibitor RaiA